MENNFLGVPFSIWGFVCLGVAVLYYYVWPEPKVGYPTRPVWMHIVLRWFHSLVWLLLAAACFIFSAGMASTGRMVAGAGLLAYVIFIVTNAIERSQQRTK